MDGRMPPRAGAGTIDGCWVGGRCWMGGHRRAAVQVQGLVGGCCVGGCRRTAVQVQGLSTVGGLVGDAGWEDAGGRPATAGWGDVDGRPCRCRDYRRLVGWWAMLELDGRTPTDGRTGAGTGRRLLDGGMSTDGRAGAGTIDGCWVGGRFWMGDLRDGGVARQELPGSIAENEEDTKFFGGNQVGDRPHFCCLQATIGRGMHSPAETTTR